MSLFSESFKMELSDIHIILGPCKDHLSNDNHFADDPKTCPYDIHD
jgi:hypothetical protein